MIPFQSTSGDPSIDRRADYAEMLLAEGEPAAAAEIIIGALEHAPGWTYGWFRAGEMNDAAGLKEAAITAFGMAASLDEVDRLGASLKLALLRNGAPVAMPVAFVETLFDQYADTFDAALVDRLSYRVPALLETAIERAAPSRRFRHAVDLGCGTGLMGVHLRPRCDRLNGLDLSAAMLRKAAARGVYDALEKADLNGFAPAPASLDLVVAADVFMYVADLGPVFASVARGLETGGLFAFSVEKADAGIVLRASRRYAHGADHVRHLLAGHGFAVAEIGEATIRRDGGEDIVGLIVTAMRA